MRGAAGTEVDDPQKPLERVGRQVSRPLRSWGEARRGSEPDLLRNLATHNRTGTSTCQPGTILQGSVSKTGATMVQVLNEYRGSSSSPPLHMPGAGWVILRQHLQHLCEHSEVILRILCMATKASQDTSSASCPITTWGNPTCTRQNSHDHAIIRQYPQRRLAR